MNFGERVHALDRFQQRHRRLAFGAVVMMMKPTAWRR